MALRTQDAISSATNFFQEHGFICSCGYNGPTPARAGQPSPAQHEPCLTHQPTTGALSAPVTGQYQLWISMSPTSDSSPTSALVPHWVLIQSALSPASALASHLPGANTHVGIFLCPGLVSAHCGWGPVGTRPDTYMVISHYPLSPSYPGFTLPEEVATTHMCPYTLYACMW